MVSIQARPRHRHPLLTESHPLDAKSAARYIFKNFNGIIAHISGYGAERHHGHNVVDTLACPGNLRNRKFIPFPGSGVEPEIW